jgi:MFS family permease
LVTVAGPATGGAIVEWTSWRWIFFLNLPLAGVALLTARLGRCDERGQLRQGRLDLPGAVLAAALFGPLTYALVEGADRGFGDVWWGFAAAAVALVAFVWVERRVAEPMLPFRLFRVRNFLVANLATFFIYASLYGTFVYFALYLQFLGFTPFEAGLASVPSGAALVLLAARFGALADRYGPRLFLTGGPILMAAGSLLYLGVTDRGDFWSYGIAGLLCFSLGTAAMVAPITSTALKSAPSEFAGIASGVNSTVSRLGSLIAIAVIGLAISVVFHSQVDSDEGVPLEKNQSGAELRDASTDGFRVGMLVAAGLGLAGAAVAGIGISNTAARSPASEPEAARAGS